MNKIIEKIRFCIDDQVFVGSIRMIRNGSDSDMKSKTCFLGSCSCEKGRSISIKAQSENINEVRSSLYDQADEIYRSHEWKSWLLIKVVQETYNEDRASKYTDIPRPLHQELKLRIEVERYRSSINGDKEIWSDYYKRIPKPRTSALKNDSSLGDFKIHCDSFEGALIPDDERSRAFIERLRDGINNLKDQITAFLSNDNIQTSIQQMLSGNHQLMLESGSDEDDRHEAIE